MMSFVTAATNRMQHDADTIARLEANLHETAKQLRAQEELVSAITKLADEMAFILGEVFMQGAHVGYGRVRSVIEQYDKLMEAC